MQTKVVILRSNPIAPDPRVEKIASSLIADGYQVSALGWDRSGKLPKIEDRDGLLIHRLRISARYGSGLMNFPALIIWQVGLFWWLIRNRQSYQIIHSCDFDTILPSLICKFLWKKHVVYDIFDFYADHLRKTPLFLKKLIRRIDFWAINMADGVILVDEARREQIQGSSPKICISIYNSPNDVSFLTSKKVDGSSPEKFRITYVGLLQVERGIFEMIEVLRRHPDWHLDLAGFGGDEEEIVAIVSGLPNITWHGRIGYDHAIKLSEQGDVLFATYDPSIPNHRFSSANKIFEAMMLGKPVIVAENTNMDRIVQEMDCGVVVKYGDIMMLEDGLLMLEKDPNSRQQLGKNARKAYDEVYSWKQMETKLKKFYDQILHRG